MILFCNYETYAVAADKDGKKFKAQGGQRVMYTTHHPCWDAKNRADLPPKIPLDYAQIAHVIEHTPAIQEPAVNTAQVSAQPPQTQTQQTQQPPTSNVQADLSDFEEVSAVNIPDNIPKPLQDLMRTNNVSEEDIRFAVASKGYFPERMPIANYPPDFINGVLVGAWEQVYAMIKENKKLPF